ncbi:MAG TPA: flagellar hook-basal body complex protein FliE [Pirellulaceae bacterium]|nr:flagellar hook-basal body complex protein FliE [Pirellulaceae bacterium]
MSRISGFPISPPTMPTSPGVAPTTTEGPQFKNYLLESLEQVNSMQADADKAVEQMMTGEDLNPAEVLTAVQKADLTFRMMMQVRNKLVAAYQEIKDVRI